MERKMIAIDEVSFFFRWIRASGVIAFSGTRSDLRAFDSSKDEEIIFAVFNYRDCAKSTEARHFLSFIMFPFKTWPMIVFFRENNQIIGSYLEIEDITLEDYGEYKCEVSNGVDEEITLPAHVYRQGKFHPARITRNATRAYRWRKLEKETSAYPLVYR